MSRARREIVAAEPADSVFRAFFDQLPEPLFVWQRSEHGLHLLAHNRAAVERAGALEAAGATARAVFAACPEVAERLEACIESAEVRWYEGNIRDSGGGTRRVELTFVPVGERLAVVHERDVTEEHLSREALRESERHVRTLIRSNPEALIRMTGDGKYVDFHAPQEVRAFLSVEPEQCIGRYIDDFYDPEFSAQHAYYRRKVLEEGTVQFWQYARRTPEGLVNLEARFVQSGDDEVLITVRDVGQHVEREREIVLSVERERNRIGRDLHDGLAQLLTGANLLLEPIKEPLGRESGARGENLYQAIDLIQQAIAQTRELARGLSPVPQGSGFSLSDALAELAHQSQDYFGLSCRCECRGPIPALSTETSANLYRIAQEAITNAVKHGRAEHVRLSCRVVDGHLQLRVEDDGCGIGLDEALSAHRGMGLNIMRYRARAIGAELAIGPGQHGGTVVECALSPPQHGFRSCDAAAGPGG